MTKCASTIDQEVIQELLCNIKPLVFWYLVFQINFNQLYVSTWIGLNLNQSLTLLQKNFCFTFCSFWVVLSV